MNQREMLTALLKGERVRDVEWFDDAFIFMNENGVVLDESDREFRIAVDEVEDEDDDPVEWELFVGSEGSIRWALDKVNSGCTVRSVTTGTDIGPASLLRPDSRAWQQHGRALTFAEALAVDWTVVDVEPGFLICRS